MKRKLLSALLITGLVFSMTACGSSSGSGGGSGDAPEAFDDYARPVVADSDKDVSVIYLVSNM